MEVPEWNEFLLPYEQAVDELVVKFRNLDSSFRKLNMVSPIESVEGRVKKVSSMLEKAHIKGIPLDRLSELMEDIGGVRIICRFVEDIERVLEIIRGRSGVDLEITKERDYISNAKSSGYRSYHVIVSYPVITAMGYKKVLCEIQIRTLAMNFWATIEHSLKYKYNGKIPDELHGRLIICAEAASRLDSEMSAIRGELSEAQYVISTRTRLVDEILERIQALQTVSHIEQIARMNRTFFELYESGDIEGLSSFNVELKGMMDTNRI